MPELEYCYRCDREEAKCYDDIDEVFKSRAEIPYCKLCHNLIKDMLDKKCMMCGTARRSCVC